LSGGGPSQTGSASSSTTSSPWGPSTQLGKLYINDVMSMFGGGLPTMPANLNQQVAPMTAGQTSALSGMNALTPTAMNLTGLGAGEMASFASGAQNNPSSNPELAAYYNAAAGPMVQNYQNAIAPSIMAQGQQSGSVGGTGYNQALNTGEYNLGQGLGTLGANIFEPAFQQGQQLQYNAAQGLPAAAMSLYSPLSAQYSAGATQQQQSQNVLNTNYQNALSQAQWPFAMLSELGGAFGATSGAGGTTIGSQPIIGGGGGLGSKL